MAINSSQRNVDSVPGTEFLITHDGNNSEDATSSDRIVLIPEPSDHADDPLNWSPTWKATVIINQAIFVFISVLTPLSIAPITPIFMHEFNKSLPAINMLFGAAAITLGYANFIIVPVANIFGRRPIMLLCGFVCILANMWQALVTSYGSFIGARIISGFGAAANESIMPMVIADVMFLHQRGSWMGLYFWSYFIGVFFGPIIAGNIAAHISWRWFFWVCTILQGANWLVLFFTTPETLYIRDTNRPSSIGSQGINTAVTEEPKSEGPVATTTKTNSASDTDDKNSSRRTSDYEVPLHHRTHHLKGRPARHQFSLVPRPKFLHGNFKETIFRDVFAPIEIFFYPITFWAAMSLGFASNCLLALNLTQSQVFAAPPYLFTPAQVGFVNFAFVVGGVIGLLTAGPLSDWVSIILAKRNGGVREAEMRLWVLIPYTIICLIGMTVAAIGYQRHWNWPVIVVVGYGFVGIEVVAIPAIVIAYAVDCYKQIPGQIMVTATVIKNTFGFGMIFFFNDWAVTAGFIPPVMTLMALGVGITAIGIAVFLVAGKKFRMRTKHSKMHTL